jgi:hypothetical protein
VAISAPSQIQTNYDFAKAVLSDAGLPVTDNNAANLLRWIKTEKPSNQFWYQGNNPLNLNTQRQPDGYDRYPSIGEGAQRTAAFLAMPNYKNVRAVLANNGSPVDFSAAVIRSPWAESHYGVASAGAPSKYVVQGRGLDYLAGIPAPAVYNYQGQNVGGAPPAGASNQLGTAGAPGATLDALNNPTRAAGTCDPGKNNGGTSGWVIPHTSVAIFTGCQVKALIGGLCVGFGAGIMLTGMVVIATRSKTAQQAIGVASGVATGGASRVAGVARGIQSSRVERRAAEDDEYYESLPEASAPVPRNRRQANRQAEDIFDRLGVSRPLGATADEPF